MESSKRREVHAASMKRLGIADHRVVKLTEVEMVLGAARAHRAAGTTRVVKL